MKRILCILLALLSILGASFAEGSLPAVPDAARESALTDTAYIHYGDYGLPIESLQYRLGVSYLNDDSDAEPYFCSATLNALLKYQAEHSLVQSGCFDSDTLRSLLRVPEDEHEDITVWIPMHGGRKCHTKESCSGMKEPRKVPLDCAGYLGFEPCKKCYK